MKVKIEFNGATVIQGDLIRLFEIAFGMRIKAGTHVTAICENEYGVIQTTRIITHCDGEHAAPCCDDPECWQRE